MESSVVIPHSKFLFVTLILFASLAPGAEPTPVPAASPATAEYLAGLPAGTCRNHTEQIDEVSYLFSIPSVGRLMKHASLPRRGEVAGALGKWSSDLLVHLGSVFDQQLVPDCQDTRISYLAGELKIAFLQRMKWKWQKASESDIDTAFRGLIVQKADVDDVAKRVALSKRMGTSVLEQLSAVYGGKAQEVRGVLLLGAGKVEGSHLSDLIAAVCPDKTSSSVCPLWDRRVLYRVVVVKRSGVGVFIPELSSLLLSRELLAKRNLLYDVVVTHELAHVLQRSFQVRENQDVAGIFAGLAGWKKNDQGKWQIAVGSAHFGFPDELSRLSASSSFSILPDSIYGGLTNEKGETSDGFVLAKSYEESIKRNDPSEDFADSLSILRWVPQRFCFQGHPLAPRKEGYLRGIVPFKAVVPPCEKQR